MVIQFAYLLENLTALRIPVQFISLMGYLSIKDSRFLTYFLLLQLEDFWPRNCSAGLQLQFIYNLENLLHDNAQISD